MRCVAGARRCQSLLVKQEGVDLGAQFPLRAMHLPDVMGLQYFSSLHRSMLQGLELCIWVGRPSATPGRILVVRLHLCTHCVPLVCLSEQVRDRVSTLQLQKRLLEISAKPRVTYRIGDLIVHKRYGTTPVTVWPVNVWPGTAWHSDCMKAVRALLLWG